MEVLAGHFDCGFRTGDRMTAYVAEQRPAAGRCMIGLWCFPRFSVRAVQVAPLVLTEALSDTRRMLYFRQHDRASNSLVP